MYLSSATSNLPQAFNQKYQSKKEKELSVTKLKELQELQLRGEFMEKLKNDETYKGQLHVARTLGQSYYDDSTDEKAGEDNDEDDKQLVTRYMERIQQEVERTASMEGKDAKEGDKQGYTELPILVVKQLWLWTVDKSMNLDVLGCSANLVRDNHYGLSSQIQQP